MTLSVEIADLSDIAKLTNRHRIAMAKVVLSFARMDTQLSNWMVEAFQMRSDRAALLLQNMAISTKYSKLAKLYEHEGPRQWAVELRKSKKEFEHHAEVRNTICHAQCIGTFKHDQDYVLFLPLSYIPGQLGMIRYDYYPLEEMAAASEWADSQAGSMIDVWAELANERPAD